MARPSNPPTYLSANAPQAGRAVFGSREHARGRGIDGPPEDSRPPPRIVELDYALGWALRGIAAHEYLSGRLLFKGGTCLRKCYFPDYRLSEDLDFTATEWFDWKDLEKAVAEAFSHAAELSGIDFAAQDPKVRIIDKEYGRETLRFTLYWRGPHSSGGSPPGLRLDITRNEEVVFEPLRRVVTHSFSDSDKLGTVEPNCYTLEEMMAEKVRAVLGQRIYAVSRDLYDIYSIRAHVEDQKVVSGLPRKMRVRNIDAEAVNVRRLTERLDEFRADWERNLAGLLPPGRAVFGSKEHARGRGAAIPAQGPLLASAPRPRWLRQSKR